METTQIRKWTVALTKIVLAQRTESSQKLRKKLAAYYRKQDSEKRQRAQRWPGLNSLKELIELPAYSRRKARDVKRLLAEYHFCINRTNLIPIEAERVMRALWLLTRGESVSGRTIRLWKARERAYGGAHRAPIKCYADRKSFPRRSNAVLIRGHRQ